MTQNGDDVQDEIQGVISKLEKFEREAQSKLDKVQYSTRTLVQERDNLFTKLAEFYLPEMDADAIKNTLREKQAHIEEIYAEKEERRTEVEQKINNLTEKRLYKRNELTETTHKLNDIVNKREELSALVNKELKENKEYHLTETRAEQAKQKLARNKLRVQEMNLDAKEKLPAFENNKLFMYLYNNKFGTDSHRKKGITRNLDSWVAKIVNYDDNRENYIFLKSMPELMEIELKKRNEEMKGVIDDLTSIETKLAEKYNLPKVIEKGIKTGKQRDSIQIEIKELTNLLQEYSEEKTNLESTRGVYYNEAIEELRSYLKTNNISSLKQKALDSPRKEDDVLVARIEKLDEEMVGLNKQYKTAIDEKDEIQNKINKLERIEDKFTGNDYESSRSRFDSSFDMTNLLEDFLSGKHTESYVLNEIEDNQHFKPVETCSSSSYGSSSSWGSSSSSSSSGGGFGGGGGFSSGGGFSGGGFSSGGGF
ncbi:MAG: hypothetical protein ABIB43_00235 [archaeon]